MTDIPQPLDGQLDIYGREYHAVIMRDGTVHEHHPGTFVRLEGGSLDIGILPDPYPSHGSINGDDLELVRRFVAWVLEEQPELTCPYLLGTGTCNQGCRDEPVCHTNGPMPILTQRIIDWAQQ